MRIAATARGRRVRQAAVLAGSAAFHVALFLVAFARASGDLVSAGNAGGGPSGPVFAVTLVRLRGPDAPAPAEAAMSSALPMKLRHVDAPDGVAVDPEHRSSPLAALADRLTSQEHTATAWQRFPADRVQPQGSFVTDDRRLSDARSRQRRINSDTEGETGAAASTGSLWGAIEPCWRNMGFRGQVPVTIEVSLNGEGAIRGPPKVLRAETAQLSEVRLRSEANALAALAACMPRGQLRVAATSYRLEFPGTP